MKNSKNSHLILIMILAIFYVIYIVVVSMEVEIRDYESILRILRLVLILVFILKIDTLIELPKKYPLNTLLDIERIKTSQAKNIRTRLFIFFLVVLTFALEWNIENYFRIFEIVIVTTLLFIFSLVKVKINNREVIKGDSNKKINEVFNKKINEVFNKK